MHLIHLPQDVNIVLDGPSDVEGSQNDVIELSADQSTIWATNGCFIFEEMDGYYEATGIRDFDLKIHLEGNVVFRQNDRVMYLDRLLYDVNNQVGQVTQEIRTQDEASVSKNEEGLPKIWDYDTVFRPQYIGVEELGKALSDWMGTEEERDEWECFRFCHAEGLHYYYINGMESQVERMNFKIAELDILHKENENDVVEFSLQNVSVKKALESLEDWKRPCEETDAWDEFRLTINERTNRIIASGRRGQLELVEAKIAEIDVAPKQIQMEMTLLDVDLEGEESGVLRRLVEEKKETMSDEEALESAVAELTEAGRLEVLSRPTIRAVEDQQATIQVGELVPVASDDGTITHEEIGWRIEVTPRRYEGGRILTWYFIQHRVMEDLDGSVRTISQTEFACAHRQGLNDFDPITVGEYNGTELVMIVSAEVVVEE